MKTVLISPSILASHLLKNVYAVLQSDSNLSVTMLSQKLRIEDSIANVLVETLVHQGVIHRGRHGGHLSLTKPASEFRLESGDPAHTGADLEPRSQQTYPKNILRTAAYHEAGHAVVDLLFGRWIEEVKLGIAKQRVGICESISPNLHIGRLSYQRAWEARIVSAYAGVYAEDYFWRHPPGYTDGGGPDRKEAGEDIKMLCWKGWNEDEDPTEWQMLRRVAKAAAKKAVGKSCNAIYEVAQALIRKRRLSGEEVYNLAGQWFRPMPYQYYVASDDRINVRYLWAGKKPDWLRPGLYRRLRQLRRQRNGENNPNPPTPIHYLMIDPHA